MDEVIANHTESFNEFHDEKYGTNLKEMDITDFYLRNLIEITPQEELKRVTEYYSTKYFKNTKPVAGAVEAVKELAKNNNLYLITSRPDFVEKATKEWINKYFPNCFKEVVLANHFFGGNKKKSEVCVEKKIDYMIEDIADYANDCATVCKKSFLIKRPWNVDRKILDNVVRVENWEEIKRAINDPQPT